MGDSSGIDAFHVDPFCIDIDACRGRQRRLLERLEKLQLEMAVLTRPESVQWLTGAYVGPHFEMAMAIDGSGEVTLVVPSHMADVSLAVDHLVPYQAQLLATLRDDQWKACSDALLDGLAKRSRRVGGEFAYLSRYLIDRWDADWTDVEDELLRLRRRKEPDELRMLRRANEANQAMYDHARLIIEPGIDELEVYNQLQTVATKTLGEPLTYFGQDFQCNSMGGPPRCRQANEGELWILDLGVGFRGYKSDNCRTVAVAGEPDEKQSRAQRAICEVFERVESSVRPGVSCRQLYDDVNEQLSEYSPWSFPHHLGHGVGLAAHESPRLNPNWDDAFEVGDFFTVEPGLYHEQLRHGLRLEQNYVVTDRGVELMTDWPLDL
ncbi:Xaa-Pro peptidase family protein [Pirellulales bacterium]|nr:Xaa-Pro peptidase family protein [Pirellulales bacterium]